MLDQTNIEQIIRDGMPVFPQAVSQSTAGNASPYCVDWTALNQYFGTSKRRQELLAELSNTLKALGQAGATYAAVLIGGSFADPKAENPRDLDTVCFYLGSDAISMALLKQTAQAAHANGIDMRFVPYDADPAAALKACSFFTLLYARTRSSAEMTKGAILLGNAPLMETTP